MRNYHQNQDSSSSGDHKRLWQLYDKHRKGPFLSFRGKKDRMSYRLWLLGSFSFFCCRLLLHFRCIFPPSELESIFALLLNSVFPRTPSGLEFSNVNSFTLSFKWSLFQPVSLIMSQKPSQNEWNRTLCGLNWSWRTRFDTVVLRLAGGVSVWPRCTHHFIKKHTKKCHVVDCLEHKWSSWTHKKRFQSSLGACLLTA